MNLKKLAEVEKILKNDPDLIRLRAKMRTIIKSLLEKVTLEQAMAQVRAFEKAKIEKGPTPPKKD